MDDRSALNLGSAIRALPASDTSGTEMHGSSNRIGDLVFPHSDSWVGHHRRKILTESQ